MFPSYHPTCFYRNCTNRNSSNTKKNFFELPSDNRRDLWLKNSGISDEEASRIILYRRPIWICEDHFDPKYLQYLADGRKILLQHQGAVPIPFQAATKRIVAPESKLEGSGFAYDETATHMLQLFETSGNESDLHDYFLARNYIQTSTDPVVASNEQQLLQNYMLQAQLQQSHQLFFSQATATTGSPSVVQQNHAAAAAAAQAIVQQPPVTTQPQLQMLQQPAPSRKPRQYNRTPRNTFEEEPEPPKREVMCYSVQAGERQKTAQKSADGDIEDMLDTFFIVNDKNQPANGGSSGDSGVILGN